VQAVEGVRNAEDGRWRAWEARDRRVFRGVPAQAGAVGEIRGRDRAARSERPREGCAARRVQRAARAARRVEVTEPAILHAL
jgi:hypothetical protein